MSTTNTLAPPSLERLLYLLHKAATPRRLSYYPTIDLYWDGSGFITNSDTRQYEFTNLAQAERILEIITHTPPRT